MLVSAIIPFLDASEDVEGVFSAIANQVGIDKKAVEIIAVNDGSTDNTQEKIEQHKRLFDGFGGFHALTHEKRTGQVETRLDAARVARGKFLIFVDKRTRPDPDYFAKLLAVKRNIVVGDVYMDKTLSPWDRVLASVRIKLYWPYFNHPFKDVELDREAYRSFKVKGGGGALLVLRDYYMRASSKFKMGKDVNDDSELIGTLLTYESLVKTSSARTLYLNRTGFRENFHHLFNRGPKFVDYYIRPGTRFFPELAGLIAVVVASFMAALIVPILLLYELMAVVVLLVLVSVYFSEEPLDFLTCIWLFPIIATAFVAGIFKGLVMKSLRLY